MKYTLLFEGALGRGYCHDESVGDGVTQRDIMIVSSSREPTVEELIENLQKAAERALYESQAGVRKNLDGEGDGELEKVIAILGEEYLERIRVGDEEFVSFVITGVEAELGANIGKEHLLVLYARLTLDEESKRELEGIGAEGYGSILTSVALARKYEEGIMGVIQLCMDGERNLPPKRDIKFLVEVRAFASELMKYQWASSQKELTSLIESIYETITPDELANYKFPHEMTLKHHSMKIIGALQRNAVTDANRGGFGRMLYVTKDFEDDAFLKIIFDVVGVAYNRIIVRVTPHCQESQKDLLTFIRENASQN